MKAKNFKESVERQKCVINFIKNEELTYQQTGELCGGISRQAVEQRLKKVGCPNPRRQESKRKRASIFHSLLRGEKTVDIARELGITKESVYKAVKKYRIKRIRLIYQNMNKPTATDET